MKHGFTTQITHKRITAGILALLLVFLASCTSQPMGTVSQNSNASGTAESSRSAAESTDFSAPDTESSASPAGEAEDRWLDITWNPWDRGAERVSR
jgi:PBP1b-binding outer membrane lipoprotein LpoB